MLLNSALFYCLLEPFSCYTVQQETVYYKESLQLFFIKMMCVRSIRTLYSTQIIIMFGYVTGLLCIILTNG